MLKKARRNKTIRIGIIGYGFRGEQLAGAMNPEELNIRYSAICDVFNVRVERGVGMAGSGAKGYRDYREILARDNIDAVIIATPDHWHARMAIDAANAGKHIYLEKCMTLTVEEAIAIRDAVKANQVVFQLGHQGRQRDLNLKARELIEKGTLGRITLIETTTNRNDPSGAWIWPIHEIANTQNIDWELFQEPAREKVPFSPERYTSWRRYWAYSTGMSVDLLTHEYDAVNSILKLGVPQTAVASGGVYFYDDGREVPDVFHANFEYPERDLTLIYSGTLANGIDRGTLIMGHDASLELGRSMSVWADQQSTKYRSRIEAGIIDPVAPIARYDAGNRKVDAITSATSKYFVDRGLINTCREGKQVNTTYLQRVNSMILNHIETKTYHR